MNRNLGINDDDPNKNIQAPVDFHGQLVPNDPGENQQRGQNPAPRPQEYYRGYDNIADSYEPLVLRPLPPGHTFVVTSSLMEMLTTSGLFSGLPCENAHAHIAKVRAVCKSCVRRLDLDLDVIELRVFHISLTEEAAIWFIELPYNSIFTWNNLRDIFIAHYYLVSKKLNHKDRVNNFVALPRDVPNHRIDDESLKEYFYRGHDDNNKAVLDMIAEKINEVNYLSKPPPANDECYFAEDYYAVNEQTRVFDRVPKAQIRRIGAKVKGTKVGSMKLDTHAISIKHIELQMAQLSATMNKRQPGTLRSNIVQNPKNDGNSMAITSQGGKENFDSSMSSKEENVTKDNDKVLEGSGEVEDNTGKDAEFMKDVVTKKRSVTFDDDDRMEHYSAIATRYLVQNKEDLGAFTIPCTVGSLHFAKALCDLGASINLMPLSVYKKLGLGDPKTTSMRLLMDD
ncbi:uncharacterized protein [Solanum lycopersicum]|uniref:uncharacterized protein n=1 Tax=Solanum lycopersicum TaxID=4081 RepID=UPI0037486F4C